MSLADDLSNLSEGFENPENGLLISAEEKGDYCLKIVAETMVAVSSLLKIAAEEIEDYEGIINSESLDKFAELADFLDQSEDEFLKKQASVIDELLYTIAAPKNAKKLFEERMDARLEEMKRKYQGTKENLDKLNKISDVKKDLEKSPFTKEKQYDHTMVPLSTRYCVDHPGAMLIRRGNDDWQCLLDGKVYNWREGFTTAKGNEVPGSQVEGQSDLGSGAHHSIFTTRQDVTK